jgi:hypothetical protein
LATVSSTLDRAQRLVTGLYDPGSFLAFPPPLYTGSIRDVLKADGNTPANKDMLTRWQTGPANTSVLISRTDTGIPSMLRAEVDFRTLASPSSLSWRLCDRYVTPVVKYLMFASAMALSCASRRHLRTYCLSSRLDVSRLTSPAKTMLSTSAAAASIGPCP